MFENISIADKKPEVKSQNLGPQIRRKAEISHSMNSPVDRILFLQRTIGNQVVQKLMKSGALQAKLKVGQPGDIYEQEADRVAEHVMRMPDVSSGKDTRIQRKCPKCLKGLTGLLGKDEKDEKLQAKETSSQAPEVTPQIEANINALKGGGQPLYESTRAFYEERFGTDFGKVRVHTDAKAAEAARAVDARAYTFGQDVVFGSGQYAPWTGTGKKLLSHELTHVIQQSPEISSQILQRYGGTIPKVAKPSVTTMREFIDLVKRIEVDNPGLNALEIAEKIRKTKYHTLAWEKLLPSTVKSSPVTVGGSVTAADITTLSGEFTVTLPQGGQSDPSHIVAALVAGAEKKAPGWPISNVSPSALSQLDIASWAGDAGSAAAEWMSAHPHPTGGTAKQDYMDEFAPESDLIADVDGVAMTSSSATFGFAFDMSQTLSYNIERFYYPAAPREGKNRRFHTFCSVEGFALEADGVTLSNAAIQMIDNRIHAFADFDIKNDPDILAWIALNSPSPAPPLSGGMPSVPIWNPIPQLWVARAKDWPWFAQKFRDFVQRNLRAEGP